MYDKPLLLDWLAMILPHDMISVDYTQVLHMDRNNYYGGESASLNLNQVGHGAQRLA